MLDGVQIGMRIKSATFPDGEEVYRLLQAWEQLRDASA